MTQQWLIPAAVGWLALRLLLSVALAFRDVSRGSSKRSPFGPAGGISQKNFEFVYVGCFLVSVALGGAALSSAAIENVRAARPADAIFPAIIAGVVGCALGGWLDVGVANKLESALGLLLMQGKIPQIREWLARGTPEEMMRAATLLGAYPRSTEAAEHVTELLGPLHCTDAEVRYRTAAALMAIVQARRGLPAEMVPTVQALLADPDPKVRAPAARTLLAAGRASLIEVLRPMASALVSDDPTAWGLVSWFLDAPGRGAAHVLPEIFEAAALHGEPFTRSGIRLVFRWIEPMGRAPLEAALQDPSPAVRDLAEYGLEQMQQRRQRHR